jgi:hypothetical protein
LGDFIFTGRGGIRTESPRSLIYELANISVATSGGRANEIFMSPPGRNKNP